MKLLNRNFSTKEKLLIVILGILLIGLIYYKFVYVRLSTALKETRAEAQSLQTDLDAANARIAELQQMENQLSGIGSTGLLGRMGSYNNSQAETAFLHTVLANVTNYSLSFDDVTRDGNQIRRGFSLRYTTPNYDSAEAIMKELENGEFRCLINDVSCSVGNNGVTNINLNGTFYETMVGGTPDAALPVEEEDTVKPVELSDFE